jgi:flavin reductase (DIM6/NTAB) family NADH-FMN oxidoreductase RutF
MATSIEWYERADWLHQGLREGGAFLVARDAAGKPNPMTIGWAQVGIVWSIPVMTVFVRQSRYTHTCLRSATAFTVNVPRPGEMTEALAFCGSRSGRDLDKAAHAGLTLRPATEVEGAIIADCRLHYECAILARTQQALDEIDADDLLRTFYPQGDPHLIVLGRVATAYTTG